MFLKRIFIILILGLFVYLGMYSWNQKTRTLDNISESVGLEILSYILAPCDWVINKTTTVWKQYLDLVHVRAENEALKEQLNIAKFNVVRSKECETELKRLQALLDIPTLPEWQSIAARVIATRLGPQATLDTLMLNKGFLSGASAGTPVITPDGLLGKVFRSGPHASTVLLLTNPSCRLAVVGQDSRVQGILSGKGSSQSLEVHYVPPNIPIKIGEVVITSGLDGAFPKGLAVGVVEKFKQSDTSPFQVLTVRPLADSQGLEEVLLLQRPINMKDYIFEPIELPVEPQEIEDKENKINAQ